MSVLNDAKNVFKKELTHVCQELQANKKMFLLVEKLEVELKESLATNKDLEELPLLA